MTQVSTNTTFISTAAGSGGWVWGKKASGGREGGWEKRDVSGSMFACLKLCCTVYTCMYLPYSYRSWNLKHGEKAQQGLKQESKEKKKEKEREKKKKKKEGDGGKCYQQWRCGVWESMECGVWSCGLWSECVMWSLM